jgi:molybdopterin-binding protein
VPVGQLAEEEPAATPERVEDLPVTIGELVWAGRVTGDTFAPVRRLLAERTHRPRRRIAATSARNRLAGVVTDIKKDRVAATVEVRAGPFRLVSLMTAEAVDDLSLAVGDEVVCVVKATNVIVEMPVVRGRL